ncbi:formylglycine-generating enzyme family protein [Candidatus Latescibacterota bacterium]
MKRFLWISVVLMFFVGILSISCGKDSSTGPGDDETIVYNGITFVTIPGGTFRMGDIQGGGYDGERPVHDVTLNNFEMSIYEVTNTQYATFLNEALSTEDITASSSTVRGEVGEWKGQEYIDIDSEYCELHYNNGKFTVESGKGNNPVILVKWYGAKAFSHYYGFDLPTEAEWEFACRAGIETYFYTGNDLSSNGETSTDLDKSGWYWDNSDTGGDIPFTQPVGLKEPNAWGLYDMHGNVWELCHDLYEIEYYSSSPSENPTGSLDGTFRVSRGGSWGMSAKSCRSASRSMYWPDIGYNNLGFRVVRRPGGVTY